jgi:hypothetical protein
VTGIITDLIFSTFIWYCFSISVQRHNQGRGPLYGAELSIFAFFCFFLLEILRIAKAEPYSQPSSQLGQLWGTFWSSKANSSLVAHAGVTRGKMSTKIVEWVWGAAQQRTGKQNPGVKGER